MPTHIARLAVLGAFALVATACANGGGGPYGFAGPPNNAGGTSGTFQSGGTSTALLRFVQGSPDTFTSFGSPPTQSVDVCIDNLPFGVTMPTVAYATASSLYAVAGGISHTVALYPSLGGSMVGLECPTAPGPYLGVSTILITTIAPGTPGNPLRETIVLGGRSATSTLGLYVFAEPSFAAPTSEAVSHNAAPAYSKTAPNKSVGFGYLPTVGGTPTNLTGAENVAAPTKSAPAAAVLNASVETPLGAMPASFYDGAGVTAGTVVPAYTTPAPAPIAGKPYVAQLYAIDTAAGGLRLVAVTEQL